MTKYQFLHYIKRKGMRKTNVIMALICLMVLNSNAQIYGGDPSVRLPTRDLYDTDVMSMSLRAQAETWGRRSAMFDVYAEMAANAYNESKWRDAINYSSTALSLFENGQLYYIRGFALESLGFLKEAKKNYKASKRMGYHDAALALEELNKKIKAQKKRK